MEQEAGMHNRWTIRQGQCRRGEGWLMVPSRRAGEDGGEGKEVGATCRACPGFLAGGRWAVGMGCPGWVRPLAWLSFLAPRYL